MENMNLLHYLAALKGRFPIANFSQPASYVATLHFRRLVVRFGT